MQAATCWNTFSAGRPTSGMGMTRSRGEVSPSPDVYQLRSVDLAKTRTLTSSLQLSRSAMTLTGILLTVSLLHDSNRDYMGDDYEEICTVSI